MEVAAEAEAALASAPLVALAVVMVAMVKLHTAPAEPVKAQPHASLTRQPGNCMQAAAVAGNAEVEPVLELAVQVVVAVGGQTLKQLLIPGRLIPAAEAAAELVIIPKALGSCRAEPVAAASCASGCIRRARERGKDNYAVIQERDKDGGSKSTAL